MTCLLVFFTIRLFVFALTQRLQLLICYSSWNYEAHHVTPCRRTVTCGGVTITPTHRSHTSLTDKTSDVWMGVFPNCFTQTACINCYEAFPACLLSARPIVIKLPSTRYNEFVIKHPSQPVRTLFRWSNIHDTLYRPSSKLRGYNRGLTVAAVGRNYFVNESAIWFMRQQEDIIRGSVKTMPYPVWKLDLPVVVTVFPERRRRPRVCGRNKLALNVLSGRRAVGKRYVWLFHVLFHPYMGTCMKLHKPTK
jgi:hypothetical protein